MREFALAGGVVADERDLHGVAAERRARQRETPVRVRERLADAVTPRLLVTGMVDFVEDHEPVGGQPGELGGTRRPWRSADTW